MSEAEQSKPSFNFEIPRMNHHDAAISLMNVALNVFVHRAAAWQDLYILTKQLLEDAELQGREKALAEVAEATPEESGDICG
jgi:hypothetical protein